MWLKATKQEKWKKSEPKQSQPRSIEKPGHKLTGLFFYGKIKSEFYFGGFVRSLGCVKETFFFEPSDHCNKVTRESLDGDIEITDRIIKSVTSDRYTILGSF